MLGSGEIGQANNQTNPTLFTAVKGSQHNLGIITRFDIVAFQQEDLWGGTAFHENTTIPKQLEAFVDFTDNIEKDLYGSLLFVWLYFPGQPVIIDNLYEYTRKFANNATSFPPAFKKFFKTSAMGPPDTDTLRLTNMSSLTAELNSQPELREAGGRHSMLELKDISSNLYATLTFTNDLKVL